MCSEASLAPEQKFELNEIASYNLMLQVPPPRALVPHPLPHFHFFLLPITPRWRKPRRSLDGEDKLIIFFFYLFHKASFPSYVVSAQESALAEQIEFTTFPGERSQDNLAGRQKW